MDARAIAEMDAVEDNHWWYVGLRDLLKRILSESRFAPPSNPRVLDAGCGTGATLRFLQDRLCPSYLGGFDLDPLCLAAARRKCPEADVYASDFGRPTFAGSCFDLILSCDVISYITPAAQAEGLRRLAERLSPDGRLILHVPACPQLYGRHDRAVGTRERFTAAGLRRLVERAGLSIELLTYRMSLLFPAVMATRLPFRATSSNSAGTETSDLRRGGRFMDSFCRRLLAVENAAIRRGFRWPIGSSLLVVARPSAKKSRGPVTEPRPEFSTTSLPSVREFTRTVGE